MVNFMDRKNSRANHTLNGKKRPGNLYCSRKSVNMRPGKGRRIRCIKDKLVSTSLNKLVSVSLNKKGSTPLEIRFLILYLQMGQTHTTLNQKIEN